MSWRCKECRGKVVLKIEAIMNIDRNKNFNEEDIKSNSVYSYHCEECENWVSNLCFVNDIATWLDD